MPSQNLGDIRLHEADVFDRDGASEEAYVTKSNALQYCCGKGLVTSWTTNSYLSRATASLSLGTAGQSPRTVASFCCVVAGTPGERRSLLPARWPCPPPHQRRPKSD